MLEGGNAVIAQKGLRLGFLLMKNTLPASIALLGLGLQSSGVGTQICYYCYLRTDLCNISAYLQGAASLSAACSVTLLLQLVDHDLHEVAAQVSALSRRATLWSQW